MARDCLVCGNSKVDCSCAVWKRMCEEREEQIISLRSLLHEALDQLQRTQTCDGEWRDFARDAILATDALTLLIELAEDSPRGEQKEVAVDPDYMESPRLAAERDTLRARADATTQRLREAEGLLNTLLDYFGTEADGGQWDLGREKLLADVRAFLAAIPSGTEEEPRCSECGITNGHYASCSRAAPTGSAESPEPAEPE